MASALGITHDFYMKVRRTLFKINSIYITNALGRTQEKTFLTTLRLTHDLHVIIVFQNTVICEAKNLNERTYLE